MRQTSTTIISAYRCTAVVNTPMRKVEVLEEQDGTVWIRDTSFNTFKHADVSLIHLEHYEAQSLARLLLTMEPDPDLEPAPRNSNGNGHRPVVESAS